MNQTTLSAEIALRMGRTAWHMGMTRQQLVAMLAAQGHGEGAMITRWACMAREAAEMAEACCPYHDHGGNPAWSCGGDHP